MAVKAKVEVKDGEIPTVWDKESSTEMGDLIHELIIARVASGTAADGSAFRPYSDEYAEEKGSTSVDLRETGRMLDGVRVKAAKRKATLEVGRGLPRYPHIINADRPFADVSDAEVDGPIGDKVEALIDKVIAKANANAKRG